MHKQLAAEAKQERLKIKSRLRKHHSLEKAEPKPVGATEERLDCRTGMGQKETRKDIKVT